MCLVREEGQKSLRKTGRLIVKQNPVHIFKEAQVLIEELNCSPVVFNEYVEG